MCENQLGIVSKSSACGEGNSERDLGRNNTDVCAIMTEVSTHLFETTQKQKEKCSWSVSQT